MSATKTATISRHKSESMLGYKLQRLASRFTVHIVILVICVFWIVPVIGLLVTSFRTGGAAATSGWWTAFQNPQFSFDAYGLAFTQGAVGRGMLNSVLVTVPANLSLVAFTALLAYVFGVMKFWGRDILFLIVLSLMAMPSQMTLAPLFALFNELGIAGQYASLWVFQVGFSLPLGVLILRNFFASIPHDIFEAAEIDGASPARTFFSVAIPISLPGLFSVLIFQFINSWNDLLMPLVMLGGGNRAPVMVQIAGLATSASSDNQTLVAAGALVSLLVPLAVFFALQKYFVRGFMSGSVKG